MAKITSKGSEVYFTTGAAGSPITIESVTISKPATITVGTGDIAALETGKAVTIDGTGWSSLDGQTFRIGIVDPGIFTAVLSGSDTTGETGDVEATAVATVQDQEELCFSSITTQSPPASEIDTTTICDTERQTLAGLPSPGTVQFEGFWDGESDSLVAFRDLYDSGEETYLTVEFHDGSALGMPVIIDSMSESIGVDQAVSFSATGKITGKRTYVPTPAAP